MQISRATSWCPSVLPTKCGACCLEPEALPHPLVTRRRTACDLESAILHLLETENIDVSRMYVCGLSMGGFGTWDLIWRRPEWFAAAGPICGGGNPIHAPKYVGRAIWNWHGDADKAVAVELSDQILSAIRNWGGSPKRTVCQGLGTTLGIRPTPTANSWTGCLPTGLIHWTQDGGRSDLEVGPCSIAG